MAAPMLLARSARNSFPYHIHGSPAVSSRTFSSLLADNHSPGRLIAVISVSVGDNERPPGPDTPHPARGPWFADVNYK
jgi:hypothetical protein